MAVEAHNFNLFPSQFLPNRDMLKNPTDANFMNIYNNFSLLLPLSGTTTVSENLIPTQQPPYNPFLADSLHQKITAMKFDSTITYNNVVSLPQKRSRDTFINYSLPYKNHETFSFLGEDISQHIHHQNINIDTIISQHMEKVRVELEEKRKRQTRRLIESIDIGMMKKLKEKEEEIEKIERMNMELEEKVKSLCMENQIWRELAQSNEATANALRTNLEQVLMLMSTSVPEEDAESCFGSNDNEGWHTLVESAQDKEDYGEGTSSGGGGRVMNIEKNRLCRNCEKSESCVLILPCRHLCLCTMCGSTVHNCPVCKSYKNASVHVNF